VDELVDAIGEALGRHVEKGFLPTRTGDVRDSWADISAGATMPGYEPSVGLGDELRLAAEAPLSRL
jgi:nucleoside-diphosphate-sugar epimerase